MSERMTAEEMVALIAKEGCYFNSSGEFRISGEKTAALIEADRRETERLCVERAKGADSRFVIMAFRLLETQANNISGDYSSEEYCCPLCFQSMGYGAINPDQAMKMIKHEADCPYQLAIELSQNDAITSPAKEAKP